MNQAPLSTKVPALSLVTRALHNLSDLTSENTEASVDAYLARFELGITDQIHSTYGRHTVIVSVDTMAKFNEQKYVTGKSDDLVGYHYYTLAARLAEQLAFDLAKGGMDLDTALCMAIEPCEDDPHFDQIRLVPANGETHPLKGGEHTMFLWQWMVSNTLHITHQLIKDSLDFALDKDMLAVKPGRKMVLVKSSSRSGYVNYDDIVSRYGLPNGDMNYNNEVLVWSWNINVPFAENMREFVNRKVVL